MEPFTYAKSTVWTKCVEFATDVVSPNPFDLFVMLAGEVPGMGHPVK